MIREKHLKISVRIVLNERQALSKEIKSKILKAFSKEYTNWKNDGRDNLDGIYRLTICEKIEIGSKDEMVSIPIYHDEIDGGYLHVYGVRESV